MSGQISESSKANGSTTKWMVMDCLLGQINDNTKDLTLMIKNMVLVFSHGQMGKSTEDFGTKESNMDMDRFNSKKDSNVMDNGYQVNTLEVNLKHLLSKQTSKFKQCHKRSLNLKQVEKPFSIE